MVKYVIFKIKNNAYSSILILNQYEMNYPAFRRDTLIQIVKGKMVHFNVFCKNCQATVV
jgi:hypothetical protein